METLDEFKQRIKREEEKITGYPHIDRMWLSKYDPEFLSQPLPKDTLVGYLKSQIVGIEELPAINYFGNKIIYGNLIDKINDASKGLTSLGVQYNDRVMYLMPNIPETAYLLYGTSQIGGVSDYVDPRPDSINPKISAQKLLTLVKQENIKYIVSLDQCYLAMIKPIENELKELGIEDIVLVSAKDSMNLKANLEFVSENIKNLGISGFNKKLKQMNSISEMVEAAAATSVLNIHKYNNLVKDSRFTRYASIPYISDKLDVITHTSGTSGNAPKPIPLTNDNLNMYVHQTKGANMNMGIGDKALHILPYFAAFGVVDVLHAGLCRGWELIEVPEFSPSELGKLLVKHKPQIIIGPPTWFLNVVNDKELQNEDLSYLKMITYGGDSMDNADEIKINEFLLKHNCSNILTKGHGMSETCGCASYATNDYNDIGIMGIPMPHAIYAVVNPETKELIQFKDNEDFIEGELIISSPSVTSGLLDGKVIVPHASYDGLDFIFTRDLARMDRDGKLTFLTRSDRSFTRYDGYKVKPYAIENILKEDERIKNCVISPYLDSEKYGNMIKVTIVLNNEMELSVDEQVSLVNDLINKYFIENPNVSSRQIPSKFEFVSALPLTANGKVDFKTIYQSELTGNEITLVIDETNLSVGDIQIIPPEKKSKLTRKI